MTTMKKTSGGNEIKCCKRQKVRAGTKKETV